MPNKLHDQGGLCARKTLRSEGLGLQGVLNWIGEPSPGVKPFEFEARLYEPLFKSEDPARLGDDWIEDLNPLSKLVLKGALGSPPLAKAGLGSR